MRILQISIKTTLVLLSAMLLPAISRGDTYSWDNLQSDIAGVAQHVDPNLVNPWGMTVSSNGTIWVSDNGTGVSTLYRGDGSAVSLIVTIPAREKQKGANPTGTIVNSTSDFKVTKGGNSLPARFLFVSEDGTISGWNPTLDPTNAIIAVKGKPDNVYKGMALGMANGHNFLYATNFHRGQVDVYDENFNPAKMKSFIDPNLPKDFAPFNIRNFNGQLYVTYAKQGPGNRDDVAGAGNGFIDVFDTSGNLVRRLVSNGELNSPWGMAIVDGELWVGNFGDGKINNYDPTTGAFLEKISRADGTPLEFNGLWDLLLLNDKVFFTAGIADEEHGLFGVITEDEPAASSAP
ncbi:MAG TPA: TIGR03118 family protein [Chthoniobacterales bacterium]|jgi:uncharacterized protein (TIGR03118 family)